MEYRGRSLWFKSMFAILDGALPLWHRAFLGSYIRIRARQRQCTTHTYAELSVLSSARATAYMSRVCASAMRPHTHASTVRHEKAHCMSQHRRTRKPESWTTRSISFYSHERAVSCRARSFIRPAMFGYRDLWFRDYVSLDANRFSRLFAAQNVGSSFRCMHRDVTRFWYNCNIICICVSVIRTEDIDNYCKVIKNV